MKTIEYYKNNAEEDYMTTPISVLRYISELEEYAQPKPTKMKKTELKDVLEALKALFLFKPYTRMPRLLEIVYGILAWFGVAIIIYAWF
jgi:hypothetical protein